MSRILMLVFLTSALSAWGQSYEDKQKIADYKNDFLDEVEIYTPDTFSIDTFTFVREKYPNVRLIKTYTKSNQVILYEYFYNGSTQLASTFYSDSLENQFGVIKNYTQNGMLESTLDNDQGEWIVYTKRDYPYYDLQKSMKAKADSFIIKMYGYSFLKNNTIWSIGSSYLYNEDEAWNWTDKLKGKPTKFLVRYNVQLDKNNRYNDLIAFELDSNGNFIPNSDKENYGFEHVPDQLKGSFKLNPENAMKQAKKLGLTENDSSKAVGILYWESFNKPALINGRFRYYIAIRTKTIEKIVPNKSIIQTTIYDIYSFNPWTGEYIDKKKKKSINTCEALSGNNTGLIPDNE